MNKRIDRGDEHRNEARDSRELDVRERDPYYNLPADMDLNAVTIQSGRITHLTAPPPRTDPYHGEMVQRWIDVKAKNGTRQSDLEEAGWRPRDPRTVPAGYKARTFKWNDHDVIMVANEMLLMEIPKKLYMRSIAEKARKNQHAIDDIRSQHNQIRRDDQIVGHDSKLGGRFAEVAYVQPQSAYEGGREVAFAE